MIVTQNFNLGNGQTVHAELVFVCMVVLQVMHADTCGYATGRVCPVA